MKIRILLADDHQMFRQALCHLLQSQPDLEVVGQTGDGLQIVSLARETAPHIVCMDISIPEPIITMDVSKRRRRSFMGVPKILGV